MATSVDFNRLQVIFLADFSGSMESENRLSNSEEVGLMIAEDLAQLDDNNALRFITFGGRAEDHGELNFDELKKVFKAIPVRGTTPLAKALDLTIPFVKQRLSGSESAQSLIVVVTDGEPDDKKAVVNSISSLAQLITRDEQLAILFIQVGTDKAAEQYLDLLDNDISKVCKGFDIVDACHYSEVANLSAKELVIKAFND